MPKENKDFNQNSLLTPNPILQKLATSVYRDETGKINYTLVEENRPPTMEEMFGADIHKKKG